MNELQKVLEDLYLNKPFIYKSKYDGRTKCICKGISITNSFIFDEETTNILNLLKRDKTYKKDKKINFQLFAQPDIKLISENNHLYDFSDCYFFTREDTVIF
jgi:hypothetical protein